MNSLRILFSLVGLILLSLPPTGHAEPRDARSHSRSILISFDGAQPEVIEKLLDQRKLPRNGGFTALIDEGAKVQGYNRRPSFSV